MLAQARSKVALEQRRHKGTWVIVRYRRNAVRYTFCSLATSIVCAVTINPTVSEAIMTERTSEPQLSPTYVIDVTKPVHVSWWAAALGVTEQELAEAVSTIGVRAIEVCRYLRKDYVWPAKGCSPGRARNRPGAEQQSRRPAGRTTCAAITNRQHSR